MCQADETPWKVPGKWSLSPHAFAPEVRAGWQIPAQVTIHDVTLRYGEQTPGVVFRKHEKLKIAHALADAGIERIEGGMVATSDEDFEALATMAREMKTAEVCGFCRARRDDIERAIKAGLHWEIIEIMALDPIIKNIWGSRGKAIEVALGKKSGRYSVLLKAWELDLPEPTEAQAGAILDRIKAISEAEKRLVSDEEFHQIDGATR